MLTELLVIARQLGCLTGWDIEPLLAVSRAKLDPAAEMNLATEPEAERVAVHERVARLAAMRSCAAATNASCAPSGTRRSRRCASSGARPSTVTSSARGLDGARTLAARGDRRRPHRPAGEVRAADRARVAGRHAPADAGYMAGGHGHIVALPGVLSVAIGTGDTSDIARQRATAEGVARDLKLLSDPTRVLILTELDRTPATVGEMRGAWASRSPQPRCTCANCAKPVCSWRRARARARAIGSSARGCARRSRARTTRCYRATSGKLIVPARDP